MKEKKIYILIKEICSELNIELKMLSYGKILQVSKNGINRYIERNRFDINSEAAGRIACDKYATYEVLKSHDVPVIEHKIVFNPQIMKSYISDEGIWPEVIQEFKKRGTLVIKPNDGSQGEGVALCKNLKEVETTIHELFEKNNTISICPYYDIETEYRTFYLNGQIYLIYGKNKPYIIGDGISTVGNLINKLNLPKKSIVENNLKNLDIDSVPNKGEKIEISWKHNLSGGAKAVILENGALYDEIEKLAINAGKAMNINFATIDIVHTSDNNLYVMEVNSSVCATIFMEQYGEYGEKIIKTIYKKAIVSMFE